MVLSHKKGVPEGQGRSHRRQQHHTCPECGRRFGTEARLAHHRTAHLPKEEWRYQCAECSAPFPSSQRLKLHVANVHSGANAGPCAQCGAGPFQNRHLLQVHLAEFHKKTN